MNSTVEFWLDDKPFLTVRSEMAPLVGDIVSVRGKAYVVDSRNFAVDYSDDVQMRSMRLCVNLEPQP